MSDFILRPWQDGDKAQLVALWQIAFGDDEDYIRTYHDLFLKANGCIMAEADGKVVSAMYIMDGPTLYPFRQETLSTAYTYALATLPEYRGRGIGTAVYKACSDAALERADAACVLPAEAGLYSFYEKATGCQPISFCREARFTRDELRAVQRCSTARIPVAEYARYREMALGGLPFGELTDAFLDMEEYQAENSGGGFFLTAEGVACAEVDGNVCHIVELLTPGGDGMASAAGVAAFCPAEEYVLRSPAFFKGPGNVRPFMMAAMKEKPWYPLPPDLWWGPAFD